MSNPADKIVWLVDDNKSVRDSAGALLEASGFNVRTSASAAEFLRNPDFRSVGCLIADYDMPGMTGVQLTEALRAQGSNLPVIIITGRGDSALERRAVEAGALRLLHKPVESADLIALLEQAMLSKA